MSKTIDQIPSNVDVMLDANVTLYALMSHYPEHPPCRELLRRGLVKDLRLYIVVNTASDVIHRAMVLELLAQKTFQRSVDALNHLKQNPQIIQSLSRYKTILRDLSKMRVNILPLTYRDLHSSKEYRDNYGLMTNDSLIITVMKRERIDYIATNDRDFQRLPNIAVRGVS